MRYRLSETASSLAVFINSSRDIATIDNLEGKKSSRIITSLLTRGSGSYDRVGGI
jgi:hypothetical protein